MTIRPALHVFFQNRVRSSIRKTAASIAFCVFFAGALLAQVDTGTITGSILDASGAILPNIPITIKSAATDLSVEVRTNADGIFVSPPLQPSDYVVQVSPTGFQAQAKRVHIDVAQRADVDFSLALGLVKQTVAVEDVSGALQTESATLSNIRSEKSIKDLPLNGRNFAQLITLSVGAMPAQSQTTGSPITMKRGVTGASIDGTRLEENNFLSTVLTTMKTTTALAS